MATHCSKSGRRLFHVALAGISLCCLVAGAKSRAEKNTKPTSTMPATDPVYLAGPVPIPLEPTTIPSDIPAPYATPGDDFRIDTADQAMLTAAADSLGRFPPTVVVPPERREALMLLDAVLHDPYASQRKAVQDYHAQRAEKVVSELEKTQITDGSARIWTFYNMGFIVRTRSVTIGFDLISAQHLPGFTLSNDLMKRLTRQCDVLFISHTHWDHADPVLAQGFIEAGKPVVGPPDLWAGFPINAKLTKLDRDAKALQVLELNLIHQQLRVTVDPGFQEVKGDKDVTNNVYVIRTPDNICVAHNGDNTSYGPTSGWVDEIHKSGKIDILFLNDWTMPMPRTLRGFDPKLVISGHYEEIGHQNVWARAPYWRGLLHAEKASRPWLVMTWGESVNYDPTH